MYLMFLHLFILLIFFNSAILQAFLEVRKTMKVIETPRISKILQKARAKAELPPLEGLDLDAEIDAFMALPQYQSKYAFASNVRIMVTEPRHRMVRHMLHNAGHTVVSLHRTRLGKLSLGAWGEMEVGQVRPIKEEELLWFTEWATNYDTRLKALMDRRFEMEQTGNHPIINECKDVVKFAVQLATITLTKTRQREKKRYKNIKKDSKNQRRKIFWPENEKYFLPDSKELTEVLRKSDLRAQKLKKKIAQKLAEYADEKGKELSGRALKLITKAVNKVILWDRKEEKKRARLRRKADEKAALILRRSRPNTRRGPSILK
jgi:hypothetical protein